LGHGIGVGEVHGADAYDRSCRPVLYQDILATPGQLIPSLRKLGMNNMHNLETHGSTADNDNDKGHVDSIVCIAFCSDKEHGITS
jgi:phosphopentomutase